MHAWIRLTNLQLPARLSNALLDRFGGPDELFAASEDDLAGADAPELTDKVISKIIDPSYIPTDRQLQAIERIGIHLITREDPSYPKPLKEIVDPPSALYVRGSLDEKDRFAVALVGSRHATPYGKSVTARLARELAQAGLTVVSGGAVGIDTAAHDAVLHGVGRTLVVLGTGLDVDYPRENRRMFDQIVAEHKGALLSEFPIGSQPEPWHFPMRNRIISGLAMGVVVIEAGAQSGALLTAGIAAEQGREIMAVPGNVDRPTSRGANGLIRDGAVLIENAQDVLRNLGILVMEHPRESDSARKPNASPPPAPTLNLSESQKRLLERLNLTPRHIDALAADVHMGSSDVSVQLTLMELSGVVRRLPGNCYIRML
jgi:DNA processing protein